MKQILQIIASLIVAIIVIASAFYIYENYDDLVDNEKEDTTPPKITTVTGNTTGKTGKIVTISVDFEDNVNVTKATIYYKQENDDSWNSKSILNKNVDIQIPSNSADDWYYYVTVDDAKGNGPVGDPSIDGRIYYTISVSFDTQELEHSVFIEEGTGSWCDNCPAVSEILHDLYESQNYNFYYVSLVEDKNSLAKSRLETDYNIFGYPTTFIDGGYEVIVGDKEKTIFEDAISRAEQRSVPEIYMNLSVEVNDNGDEISSTVQMINFEDTTYEGKLKIYLTEKISWQNYDGDSYHFGFLDYITEEVISISSEEEITIQEAYDVTSYDVDNLFVIAVLFNSESEQQYAYESDQNLFDAYYADACDGANVVEGANLPPEVGISFPKIGQKYIRGRNATVLNILSSFINSIRNTSSQNTILIGKTIISATASDDSSITSVEIYIDDEIVANFTESPYEYTWNKFSIGKHTIMVKAYDDQGKTSSVSLEVKTAIYGFPILSMVFNR